MSHALVSGGAGFIGSHLVDALIERGFEVTVLDDFSTGSYRNISLYTNRHNFHLIRGDICDYETVRLALKDIDIIFHQAALVGVPKSIEDPLLTDRVNVKGTLNLLKSSLNSNVERFIYASSASIYGNPSTLPIREDMKLSPISPYACSKLAGELYCRSFYRTYGLSTVSLRYFNVYGPRQSFGSYSGVIPIFVQSLMNKKSPKIFGDGEQRRDYVYVQDVVEANMKALYTKGVDGEVFNIATGRPTTVNQLAALIKQVMNLEDIESIYLGPRPGDLRNSYADITKAEEILGYRPKISLEVGLRDVIEYFKSS